MLTHNNVKLKNITYNGQKVKKWNHNGVRIYNAGSTVTYYVDTNTAYTEEVDSEASCLSPKTFTPTKSGWNFVGWRENNTASSEILTDKIMGDSPITLYAVFKQDVTCTFISNGTQTATGTRYYNNNNVADASVTAPSGQVYSGWTWRGWAAAGVTAADASVSYGNGATISGLTGNATFYGLIYRTLTITYYNGSATASTTSGNRYYNFAGNYSNPSFTMTQAAISGWTARGWSTSSSATASISYANGATITATDNMTIYGCYHQTITLSYAGNGATSGSVAAQTGTRYFNSGNYSNPSFTLSENGFGKTNYAFSNWAIGSASGTQYAAGASVTLSANTTFYAIWKIYVADSTRSVSINLYKGQGEGWFAAKGALDSTLLTVATDIDTSLYSGAELTLSAADLWAEWTTTVGYIMFTDGINEALIANSYLAFTGVEEEHTRNLNPTITFSKSSGTVNLSIIQYATQNGGNCHYNVQGGTLRLIGRKG